MSSPLRVSASIAAVLSTTSTVVQYINDVRQGLPERLRLRDEISSASFMLYLLKDRACHGESDPAWLSTLSALCSPNGPMDHFRTALESLASKLEPRTGMSKVGQSILWPFRKEEIVSLLSMIERQKLYFELALQNDHM
jgi:hypothetical protein